MKRIILAIALCLFACYSFSQGMYGFEAGFGKATIGKAYLTPVVTGYYLKKLTRTFYVGGAITHQRYSFYYNYNKARTSLNYDDVISIRNKSSYLLFSPKIDLGIGYRKYIHLFTTFGAGILMGGKQYSYKLSPYQTTPTGTTATDTSMVTTSGDMPNLISRYSLGASGRIPTGRYWNIMVSAEYCVVPTSLSPRSPGLKTNYFCLTVGIMHKYPMTFVEY